MKKSPALKKGDQVAIISLSRGVLGEPFAKHQLELGIKRLESMGLSVKITDNALKGMQFLAAHPERRALDLKSAILDKNTKAIICAIGGDDTYKTIPFLLDDPDFIKSVLENPKIFIGFSDTTINHLMFYKLGLQTYYGHSLLNDIAELDQEMLPYSKATFNQLFEKKSFTNIISSPTWYEERTDFSAGQLNIARITHQESKGFEVLNGTDKVSGKLLGGCVESLYELITGNRYADEIEINQKYNLFPEATEWENKIVFLETSEAKVTPDVLGKMLAVLAPKMPNIKALLVGKPQDEVYYEEYKNVYKEAFKNVPILYNLNFGHAYPKIIIPYGALCEIDFNLKTVMIKEAIID